ncbi:dTDP-4-dehydrorhamnose reductase [Clostridium algidicarnis]|uniref:dTDP-4-dehydrorhamnose reductase n=1 Tax=Clostridium algidicarnis TaxID=37659 RepID=UPI001C0D96F4|nr:dTDP-4-dehydrorhamnose reductase [Clostridium algidicarnis]MBU3207610.1 dTDP-4-dehydrorhamnose reductase [Clostridium algidicarnis]
MKILITGAKGQLASQIINVLNKGTSDIGKIDSIYDKAEIFAFDVEDLDITNLNQCKTVIKEIKPNLIINCAAYTNVDSCEKQKDLAFKINSIGARNLAIVSEIIGSKLVHISTDYVFEGNGTSPYREYDITNPVSVYGKSKLLGESYVREFSSKYFILRTSWLYGFNGNNFVKTIIKAAKEKGQLKVVNDQRGNPTYAEDLVHHILAVAVTQEYGIYHCTGSGECSWYDFAKAIVKYSNINCTVDPITSENLDRAAKRPAYSALDNMMLRNTIGDNMRDWEEALKMFISKI